MKKKCVMAAKIVLTMGMTACSLEMRDGAPGSGVVAEPEASVAENAGTGTMKQKRKPEKRQKSEQRQKQKI